MAEIERERWARISPLLDELLDADEASRATRLAQVRLDDAGLADKLAELLNGRDELDTAGFLEGSVFGFGAHQLSGRVFGSYTLERALGAGGMGSVWLARRSDGRYEGHAAVKFPNLALLDRAGAERFRREGNALARLKHPNIAHLVDAGVTGGQPYLVLEYVEGEPIDRWCDGRFLGVAERIRLFLQVLTAVSHAHGKLILHRDLKPSNILVTRDGTIKLLDFGIAKLLEERAGLATQLTQIDGHAFTPEYAAPEHVQGGEATMATDVYSLGVLLYVLLAGIHPTAISSGTQVERLRALIEAEPRRMSQVTRNADPALAHIRSASPPQLLRALSGDLDNIVAKALKKAPNERYPTVDALAGDLLRHLNHEPISANADSWRYRAGKFIVRNKLILTSAASVILALGAGTAVATWKAIEANQRREQAELEVRQARASRDLLFLVYSDPAVAPDAATMLDRLAKVRAVIRGNYDDPQLKTTLLLQLSGRYNELGAMQQLLDLLNEVRQVAPRDNPGQQAAIACRSADAYISLGRFDDAQRELAGAAAHLQKLRTEDFEVRAECLASESQFVAMREQFEHALGLAKQAVELFERHGRTLDTGYAGALNQLSIAYSVAGDFARAYATIRKARETLERRGLSDTQHDLLDAVQEVQLLNAGGKPAAAFDLIEALLKNPHVAGQTEIPRFALDANRGATLLRLARYPAAVAALEAAFDGARLAGQRHFMQKIQLWLLDALIQTERIAEAQARLAATPGVADEITRASQAGVTYLLAQSRIARAQGSLQQADELAQRALHAVHARNQRTDQQLRGTTMAAARAALALQDWSRASTLAEAALEIARDQAIDPRSSAFVGEALLLKAQAELGAGNNTAADLAREALSHLKENLGPEHRSVRVALKLATPAKQ